MHLYASLEWWLPALKIKLKTFVSKLHRVIDCFEPTTFTASNLLIVAKYPCLSLFTINSFLQVGLSGIPCV